MADKTILRLRLEAYFMDYPTCEEDELANQAIKDDSDENFSKNVIVYIEHQKSEIRLLKEKILNG